MSFLGGLLTAGLSLLGGKKKQEKTVTENTVNYEKMADSAAAAGFNPLTAIRNGGSAGFSTSTTTAPTVSQLPAALGSLGGVLGDAFEKSIDPLEAKKRELDTRLVDFQLRGLDEGRVPRLYPGSTYTGTKISRQYVPSLSSGAPKSAAVPKNPAPWEGTIVGGDNPTASSLGLRTKDGRYGWFEAPVLPDGETVETVYGDNELLSTVFGVGKVVGDFGYSLYRNGKSAYEDASPSVRKAFEEAKRKAPAGFDKLGSRKNVVPGSRTPRVSSGRATTFHMPDFFAPRPGGRAYDRAR